VRRSVTPFILRKKAGNRRHNNSNNNNNNNISVMELGHLLTRSGLTRPEVSSKVFRASVLESMVVVQVQTQLSISNYSFSYNKNQHISCTEMT
jgi:hypothetical protein